MQHWKWPAPPQHELAERTRELVDELAQRRRRERRRRAGLVAAVAGVCLAAGAAVGPLLTQREAPAASYVMTAGGGLQVELALVDKAWGTEMRVAGEQLPEDGLLTLWVTDNSGYTYQVASWQATPAGRATLTAACAMDTERIAQVELRDGSDARLAAVATG